MKTKKTARVSRFANLSEATKKRIAAMVKSDKTSNEIGKALRIVGPDKSDPHKPVRGIIIQLRKNGFLPASKGKVVKMTKKARKTAKAKLAKKSGKAA